MTGALDITPSGHGAWGMVHGPVRHYRLRHGLPMSLSLVGEQLRTALAVAASRPEALARIAATRRPVEALAAADPDARDRGLRVEASDDAGHDFSRLRDVAAAA